MAGSAGIHVIRKHFGRCFSWTLNVVRFQESVNGELQFLKPFSTGFINQFPKNTVLQRICYRLSIGSCAGFHTSNAALKKDYYAALGVSKGAAAGDIKKAYYKLAKQYHPDTNKNAGAEEKFQEIQQAYEILSDDKKRSAYDQYGQTDFSGAGGGAGGGGDPFGAGGPFQGVNVDDIFKQFFGDRAGGFSSPYGFESARQSQNYILNLSFLESVHGVNKDIRIQTQSVCNRCSGKRAEPGSTMQTCPTCRGSGEENVSTGFFNMRSTCRRCQGQGSIIKDPCKKCRGKGVVMENKTVSVPVPAGIEDGQTVRVPVSYGELFVTFKVSESKIFKRSGSDVTSDISVSFSQAILGGNIRTSGLHGDVDINIPSGTQSHQQMRLVGKGIPRLNGFGKGDHYLNIKIHLPKYLTSRQKELILEFAATDESVRGTVNGLQEAIEKLNAQKVTDNIHNNNTTNRSENNDSSFDSPDVDDARTTGNSRHANYGNHRNDDNESAHEKLFLNMTPRQAQKYFAISTAVFAFTLFVLLKSQQQHS